MLDLNFLSVFSFFLVKMVNHYEVHVYFQDIEYLHFSFL